MAPSVRDNIARPHAFDIDGNGRLDPSERSLRGRVVRHAQRVVLKARYNVVGLLGRGGQAKTYLAIDNKMCSHVVLKVLEIEVADDWKSIELFEREAALLRQLNHPRVPAYIDHFRRVVDGKTQFVTVQEFVHGRDLKLVLECGRWSSEEAYLRLVELAAILRQLHTAAPPVVHRDIKPSNIILGEDDKLYLVDFGAAQAVVPTTAGGSTIIGTTGFVPIEQYMGRAVPASDIYALGATVLQMVTGIHPADFELKHSKLQFDHRVSDPALRRLLQRMLEPHVEDRLVDVSALLGALERRSVATQALTIDKSNMVPVHGQPGTTKAAIGDRMRPWLAVTPAHQILSRRIANLSVVTTPRKIRFRSDRLGVPHLLMLLAMCVAAGVAFAPIGSAPFGVVGSFLGIALWIPVTVLAYFMAGFPFAMNAETTRLGHRLVSTRSIERFEIRGALVVVVLRREVVELPVPQMPPAARGYLVDLLNDAHEQLRSHKRIQTEVW